MSMMLPKLNVTGQAMLIAAEMAQRNAFLAVLAIPRINNLCVINTLNSSTPAGLHQ
jgi:hypothetical protein